MTTFEIAGRNRKAAALVSVLQEAGISASMARESDRKGWLVAARQAGVKPPSPETVALVLEIMDGEHEPECTCIQVDVDVHDSRGCVLHGVSRPSSTPLAELTTEECPF